MEKDSEGGAVFAEREQEIKAFFLPMTQDLFEDSRISWGEKCLVLLISSLDYTERHCHASNPWLAKKMKWEVQSLANSLAKLRRIGWIWNDDTTEERRLLTPLSRSQLKPRRPTINSKGATINSKTANYIDVEGATINSTVLYKEEILRDEIKEREEETASTTIFRKFFPEEFHLLNCYQLDLIAHATSLEDWRLACEHWAGMGYRGRRVKELVDCYENRNFEKRPRQENNQPRGPVVIDDFANYPEFQ
jgi:hypothetical protein